jgi:hypothetical protein
LDDKLIYELFPRYRMAGLNAVISEQGLNDRSFSLKKPERVYRIAIVGDSTSFGWKVRRKDSFPKILEEMLNNSGDRQFEVINFSVPGYNTAQEYELLQQKVITFEPDMVILFFCGNDVNLCNYIKPEITLVNYLYNRSFLVRYMLFRIDAFVYRHQKGSTGRFLPLWFSFKRHVLGMYYYQHPIYPYPGLEETVIINEDPPERPEDVPQRYHYMLGYENQAVCLSRIDNFLKERNIKFILSGYILEREGKIAKKIGISNICDIKRAIFPRKDVVISDDDLHLNERGHLLVAGILFNYLEGEILNKRKQHDSDD